LSEINQFIIMPVEFQPVHIIIIIIIITYNDKAADHDGRHVINYKRIIVIIYNVVTIVK